MNLAHLIVRAARAWGDKPAATDGTVTRTFRELDQRSDQVAGALVERGLKPGDRVATLLNNSLDWYDMTLGLAKAGLVGTTLDPRHSAAEKNRQLADSGAKLLMTNAAESDALDGVDSSALGHVIHIDSEFQHALSNFGAFDVVDLPGTHPSDLKYTSGTTGVSKGVLHTHGSRLAGIRGMLVDLHGTENDVLMASGPLQRGSGAMAWQFLAIGAKTVVRPSFDIADVIETIQKHRVTSTLWVPTMIYKLLDAVEDAPEVDLTSLHTVHYAASPMSYDRIERCLSRFGKVFMQSYGSTEAFGGMTFLGKDDHQPGADRLASCGRESLTGQVLIGDTDGNAVPVGEIGEILLRGPSVFTEYWNQPEATKTSFTSSGWFRSGDIGRIDEDGFIYLLDRTHDKIISGGINIYPNEIEQAIYAHPDIAEAVVFGVPDSTWGEAVTAVVRTRPGASFDPDSLRPWLRARLAGYQVPKTVVVVEAEIPKGPTGKILRREVREQYWQGHDRRIG